MTAEEKQETMWAILSIIGIALVCADCPKTGFGLILFVMEGNK